MPNSDDSPAQPIQVELDSASRASAEVDAWLTELERTNDPHDRGKLLVAIAKRLRDDLYDPKQALDALIEAWRSDPTNAEVRDHLEPLARTAERWPEILETTEALARGEPSAPRAIAYAEAMATWLTREVPMPDVAHEYVERVRQLDSTHWLVHLFEAAKYEQRGDARGELEELDRAVLSARRADDRGAIHLLMASRYSDERAANPAEAKRHFSAAHQLMPHSMDALRGLERIHLRDGDLPALAEVLEKQAYASGTEAEQVEILLRLAEIYEKDFLKPDMAAEKLERAFALDPNRDEVLLGLERCYTAMRSWEDLARVLEGAIVLVEDPDQRAERLIALAEIYESKLADLAGAARAYERLEKLIPDDETLIGELARLSEKTGDWRAAVRHRTKLADLSSDPKVRARMHAMAGQQLLSHDPAAAHDQFEKAVAFDPRNAIAWTALLSEARRNGDPKRLGAHLEKRAAAAEGPRAQAQAYAELGAVRQSMGDPAGALEAWEAAIEADPNNQAAARALVGVYVAAGRYRDAAVLSDLALHAAERQGDMDELFLARRNACLIALHTAQPGRALAMALEAFYQRPRAADVRQCLVECAWTMRADPQVIGAMEALATIADTSRSFEVLPIETRVQLGEVLAVTGQRERAIAIFENVLGEQPSHAAALRGLSGLRAASGESVAAWTLKQKLAETAEDPDDRFRMLVEAADGLASQANRPDLAVQVYERARALRPTDRALLHKLLARYQGLEDWQRVFEVLGAIAASDDDAPRKAKVLMAMGQIAAKLGDGPRAVELYDTALDVDRSRLEAFERIVRILAEANDFRGLAGAYTRMLKRALETSDPDLQHALYHQLGLVYRDRLGDPKSALASFRMAAALKPDDDRDQAIVRELLALTGRTGDAVALTLERIRRDPLDPTSYGALFDLLAQQGAHDLALTVASVMAHLGVVHPTATAFHEANPPPPIDAIPGTLGTEGYARLLHPQLDPTLTEIFEVMAAAALEMQLARLGLRERLAHPGPPFNKSEFLNHGVKTAARVLGVAPPKLYAAKSPPAIGAGVTRPPSLLVHVESLPGFPLNQLAFWVGKRIAELTPPLLAHALFRSVSELKELVAIAARIAQDQRDKNSRVDDLFRAHIRKQRHDKLARAVERALAAGGALDVRRWSQLADLSSSRAGLLIVSDVETARLALVREGQSPGDLSPRDQMRELVQFFLSDEYAMMRAEIGVAIR